MMTLMSTSWVHFWMIAAGVTALYYLLLFWFIWRCLVNQKLGAVETRRKRTWCFAEGESDERSAAVNAGSGVEGDAMAGAFFDELDALLNSCKRSRCESQNLLPLIVQLLYKYPLLQGAFYRETIISVILAQAKEICSVAFTRDEVEKGWRSRVKG